MKKIFVLFVFMSLICPIYSEENASTISPDGEYTFVYQTNGKINKFINGQDYDLVIYDAKSRKTIKKITSLVWVDKIKWSPDSKRLMVQMHTRYSSLINLYPINSNKTLYVDLWNYVLKNEEKYGFEPTEKNPYPNLVFLEWDKDTENMMADYSFTDKKGEHRGKLLYDIKNGKIIKLIDDKLADSK